MTGSGKVYECCVQRVHVPVNNSAGVSMQVYVCVCVCANHMISCFHSILIFHMCVLQGPGCHYSMYVFCEALSVIVECGGKICREVYQVRGGLERRGDGGK